MFIADVLVAQGLATPEDLSAGRDLQRSRGGGLGDCLVELGRIRREDLDAVFQTAPAAPRSLADVDTSLATLIGLLVKCVYAASVETASEIADILLLPTNIVLELLEEAEQRQLLAVVGAVRADLTSERRYALTKGGVETAQTAMRRCEYIGPAPVSLDAYRAQIERQVIGHEHADQDAINAAFDSLVVSKELFTNLGPAINSGRSILLYGPPGNGKTTIAGKIGTLFKDIVYVPHCFEVDGQIIKVFDPLVHKPVENQTAPVMRAFSAERENFDRRWEACRRPVITVGGELTLEMLDLGFNPEAKFYEAPLHIKALGGVFLIDDFGRQLVTPKALLNRWITPLEDRRDHLKLNSGKSFALPFDELVVFATNLSPKDLMDTAFLRRIPYKIEVPAPPTHVFRQIFAKIAAEFSVIVPESVLNHVTDEITRWKDISLAGYQPKFIIEQIQAACRFAKAPFEFRPQFLHMALSNLHARDRSEVEAEEAEEAAVEAANGKADEGADHAVRARKTGAA
ncbi:MAG: hypothetical protein ACREEB_11760 [Caulobacteraceae bacterium]